MLYPFNRYSHIPNFLSKVLKHITMAGNACCRCIYRFFRALPVVFILLIALWSYYAYVVVFCIGKFVHYIFTNFLDFVYTTVEKGIYQQIEAHFLVLFLIFYHLLFFIFLWSFLKAILTKPIRPPHEVCLVLYV